MLVVNATDSLGDSDGLLLGDSDVLSFGGGVVVPVVGGVTELLVATQLGAAQKALCHCTGSWFNRNNLISTIFTSQSEQLYVSHHP